MRAWFWLWVLGRMAMGFAQVEQHLGYLHYAFLDDNNVVIFADMVNTTGDNVEHCRVFWADGSFKVLPATVLALPDPMSWHPHLKNQ